MDRKIVRRLLGLRGVSVFLFLCAIIAPWPKPLVSQESRYLAGQLLIATPEMEDPNFSETVIYMVEHNEDGAMGLVINRPLGKGPVADLLKGLGAESEDASGEIILYSGGPVEPQKFFVLHSDDYADKRTNVVGGGLAVTADVEIVRAIGQAKGPLKSIFVLGYAGWAPGQLEAEIRAGAWFSIPVDGKLIFDGDPAKKWERAAARRKIRT
ncbi:MAG: YqgE/AlgH family protein [Deltaproteobacteria bacterium]|nr:YqgE/AlgH family protein [Deltaproteobacteria bacterium]